jgi:UDP-N-acetylglucosamine pyrophosphorylase
MIDTNAEFIMEVTDKTKADIKGGTLIGMLKPFSFQPLPI